MLLRWCAAKSGLKVCETEVAWRRQRMLHGRKSRGFVEVGVKLKLLHKNSLKTLQETCAKFEIAGVYP